MALQTYRDLEVWQVSMELVEAVYRLTKLLPSGEKLGLVSQMRRAAVSVPCNIAEGYGRSHRGDYVRHLSIARGSAMEIDTQLSIIVRLEYIAREQATPTEELCTRVLCMLSRLISSLRA